MEAAMLTNCIQSCEWRLRVGCLLPQPPSIGVLLKTHVSFFGEMSMETLDRIATATKEMHFLPGSCIFEQGKGRADGVYLIVAGSVSLHVDFEEHQKPHLLQKEEAEEEAQAQAETQVQDSSQPPLQTWQSSEETQLHDALDRPVGVGATSNRHGFLLPSPLDCFVLSLATDARARPCDCAVSLQTDTA